MKRTAVIILLGLLAVAGASAYFYYRWVQLNNLSPILGSSANSEEELPADLGKITNGKNFISDDGRFQFRYPQDWFLVQLTPGKSRNANQSTVELWQLTSFKPGSVKSRFPPGSVRIDLEISLNNKNRNLENLLACGESNVAECRSVKINEVVFRRMVLRLPSGGQSITVAAIQNEKIYQTVGYPTPGDGEEEATKTLEMVIETFKFSD